MLFLGTHLLLQSVVVNDLILNNLYVFRHLLGRCAFLKGGIYLLVHLEPWLGFLSRRHARINLDCVLVWNLPQNLAW